MGLWQTPCSVTDIIDNDGFRANVGIVLMRADGQVFLGRRTGGRGWQFPQGGLRTAERAEQAVFRELNEEVGLTREDVTVLGRTERWLRYRLPARYVRRNRLPVCIGQKQRWYLLRLNDDQARFRLDVSSEPEFDDWRWVEYWEPVREVIFFKRPVYVRALTELASLAFPQGAPAEPEWWSRVTEGRSREAGAAAPAPLD